MARLDILLAGYVGDRVAGTVSLVRQDDVVAVIDPGMVPDRGAILRPLTAAGVHRDEVSDVVISHHHPDHPATRATGPEALQVGRSRVLSVADLIVPGHGAPFAVTPATHD